MRLPIAYRTACLLVFPALYALAAPPAQTPATHAPATSAPATEGPDAAAKHAKRTQCLKDAKTKKLVGEAKNAYVKDCAAAS